MRLDFLTLTALVTLAILEHKIFHAGLGGLELGFRMLLFQFGY